MTSLHPAMAGRHSAGSICRTRLWKPTVLSLSTVRSNCCEKIRSRFLLGQGRNAEPCCGAGNVNLRLNSATYSVARNTLTYCQFDRGKPGGNPEFDRSPPAGEIGSAWRFEPCGIQIGMNEPFAGPRGTGPANP